MPQTLADSRAAVCKTCPKNQPHPIYQNLAAPVALQLRRQIEAKAQMKLAVNGEEDLHICEACWCVLSLKVQTPIQVASKGLDLTTLPDFCWIRKEFGK